MRKNMDMPFRVIVTVGDALIGSPDKLSRIDKCGSCLYRINGAHLDEKGVRRVVKKLRGELDDPKILLDLPGNKVRVMGLSEPVCLIKGDYFELHNYQFNFPEFHKHLKVGQLLFANDSNVTMEVASLGKTSIRLLSHSDDLLVNNRGLHVRGIHKDIPFLFDKDKELIKIAADDRLAYVSASFVRNADDIKEVKKLLKTSSARETEIIAKIETAHAVQNLDEIMEEIDIINIDRGDLSSDIGMLELPSAQEGIIERAVKKGVDVFLATQFLKNMEKHPVPLIAEIMDLYKSIKHGISGIQLSEETAIGKYPVECVQLAFTVAKKCLKGKVL